MASVETRVAASEHGSTRPEDMPDERLVRSRTLRRIGLGLLSVFILAGLFGLLGVWTSTVSAEARGYILTVEYAAVTRPGLAASWVVEVHHGGGFDGPVTLATDADYFDRFDVNQLSPEPASTSTRGDLDLLTFEDIEGDRLRVRFDGRVAPAFALALARGSTSVEIDGEQVVRVEYTTVAMP
jgi:hypothetical protein